MLRRVVTECLRRQGRGQGWGRGEAGRPLARAGGAEGPAAAWWESAFAWPAPLAGGQGRQQQVRHLAAGRLLSRKLRREHELRSEREESERRRRPRDAEDAGAVPGAPAGLQLGKAPSPATAVRKGLRVGLIGAPNAGKSMLTNVLLGRKITAVSGKVNTTTNQTYGVLTESDTQLTIFDTPGVVDSNHMYHK